MNARERFHDIWNNQGLLDPWPRSPLPWEVLAEDADTRTVRTPLGGIQQQGKHGTSISHTIEPDLKPTPEDWRRFTSYLNPDDPARWRPGWERRADRLNRREHMTCFFGSSLFGRLRDALGVEGISYLPYDDPELFASMIAFLTEYYLALNRPLLSRVSFDVAYIFEDCCFNTGPLLSPEIYRRFFDAHYRRLVDAYHSWGVPLVLIDSDGKIDELLPCWLGSGFDIVFPIEVGTWRADAAALRRQYGRRLRMMGGVNKHVIPRGEAAIRAELARLSEPAREGGFVPMPDHRIPPDCSLDQFRTYLRVFKELFG